MAPFKIVVFTGGAVPEDACVEFIAQIHARPELDVLRDGWRWAAVQCR